MEKLFLHSGSDKRKAKYMSRRGKSEIAAYKDNKEVKKDKKNSLNKVGREEVAIDYTIEEVNKIKGIFSRSLENNKGKTKNPIISKKNFDIEISTKEIDITMKNI